jgi:hypothetical protein
MATLRELVQNQTKDEARLAQAKRGSAEYKKIQDRINRRQELIQQADGTREFPGRPILPETTDPSLQTLTIDEPGITTPTGGDTVVFGGQNYSVADLIKRIEDSLGVRSSDSSPSGPGYALSILQNTRPDLAAKYESRSASRGTGVEGYGIIIRPAGQFKDESTDTFVGAGAGAGDISVGGGKVVPVPPVTSAVITSEAANARVIFNSLFKQYFNRPGDDAFIKSLTTAVEDYIAKGYTEDTIRALLPQTEAYQSRFAGNKGRQAAGLAVYSPAEYLQAEDTYAEILNRFNLGKLATREQFSDFIGNRKSASEVADLVQNVYDRIRYADPNLKTQLETLKEFNISESDLAASILSGDKTAQELKRKIAGAEVATEAGIRGLSTTRAQELANLGVTREQARTGFEAIAQTAPTLTKLGQMYGSPATAADQQTELEKEQFQGLASERRRRLAEQEQAAFMGRSGTANISLGRRTPGSI